jgi:hypothetical protein
MKCLKILKMSESKLIIKNFIDNSKIVELAKKKLEIDQKITKIIQAENPFFSYKKLIGDLGEFHAINNIREFFDQIDFLTTRVSDQDLKGILKDEYAIKWGFPHKKELNIEVKTRYFQKGNPHLSNIHINNFDLLVFVSLNEDYSIHYISMVKSSDLSVTKNNKVIYSKKIKPLFATSDTFLHH